MVKLFANANRAVHNADAYPKNSCTKFWGEFNGVKNWHKVNWHFYVPKKCRLKKIKNNAWHKNSLFFYNLFCFYAFICFINI
jgi:hypothetical protein